MKKIIFAASFLVLGFLFSSTSVSAATTKYAPGCTSTTNYSMTTGQKCLNTGTVLGATLDTTPDTTPRIMYWWGKVNQHIDANGVWQTDPDGVSGANIDKLTYCKKWYPTTTSVVPYQSETISTWHDAGNVNNYTATITSDKCVTDTLPTPSVKVLSPNGGEAYQAGQQITVTWSTQNVPTGFRPSIVLDDRRANSIGGIILASETVNDGMEVVNLPTASTWTNMPYGTFFKVRVAFAEFGGAGPFVYMDESDNLITIQAPTPTAQCGDGIDNDTDGLIDYPADPGCISTSDNSESNPATQTPSITVLSPNGGEIYQFGQQVVVKWASANYPVSSPINISIGYSNPSIGFSGTYVENLAVTTNTGSRVVTLPTLRDPFGVGTHYKVYVSAESNPLSATLVDASNNLFTIQAPTTSTCTSTSAPSIKVLSPNGGESYLIDQQIPVQWSTCNIPSTEYFRIGLLQYDLSGTIVANVAVHTLATGNAMAQNSGSATIFELPNTGGWGTYMPGNFYKISILRCMNGGSPTGCSAMPISDLSDGLFAIQNSTNICTIGYFGANPSTITAGGTSGLHWSTTGCQNAMIGNTVYAPNGFLDVGPLTQTMTYTLYAGTIPAGCLTFMGYSTTTGQACSNGAVTQTTTVTVTNGTGYPAGCTSNLGYSTTTGVPCTNPVTWVVGCISANGYSMTTGQSCNWTPIIPNLPQGCATSTGYSATTGQPCFGTAGIYCPTNASPKVTVLAPNGGESYQPGQQALVTWKTCKIPANTMMRIDLVMAQPNGGTVTRIIKNTINDGTETITLPTTATWTPMVYGNNFKIKVRKLVGNGNNLPQDFSDANFKIQPVTLTVATSPTTPLAQIVQVSNTATTNDVTLLKFTLKASGSDLMIDKVPVFVSAADTAATDLDQMVDSMTLKINGQSYSESVDTNNVAGTIIAFDNLDYDIADGETATVEVLADINNIHTGFAQGDTLTAMIRATEVAGIDVEDVTGDQLPASQRIGSTIGNTQTFYSEGILVSLIATTAQAIYNGANYGDHTMKIKVTAFGNDAYLDKSFLCSASMNTPLIGADRLCVHNASGTSLTYEFGSSMYATDSNSQEKTHTFKIPEGNTAAFSIKASAGGTGAMQRAVLYGLEWGTADAPTLTNVYNIDMGVNGIYKTPYVYVPM